MRLLRTFLDAGDALGQHVITLPLRPDFDPEIIHTGADVVDARAELGVAASLFRRVLSHGAGSTEPAENDAAYGGRCRYDRG